MPEIIAIGKNVQLVNSELDEETRIADYASIKNCKVGKLSSIGRYSKIVHTEIGSYCAISWDVTINAISHPYDHLTINAFPYVPYVGNFVKERNQTYHKVVIKNDVWIGANAVIMPNITIGNGAIIGAGAVVTKNVPDYAIVVSSPAKVIKYRFDTNTIEKLLELEWWSLDKKAIKDNIHLFESKFTQEKLVQLKKICKKTK